LVVIPAVQGCFLVYYYLRRATEPELARRFALATAGQLVVTIAFLIASAISSRVFPVPSAAAMPDLARVLRFLANLFVPFECPLGVKIALVGVVFLFALLPSPKDPSEAVGARRLGDAKLVLLLAIVSGCALMWGFLRTYTLTPRYLYLASAFSSMILARIVSRVAAFASARLKRGPRSHWAVAAMLVIPLLAANVYAIETLDVVHFEYLGLLGRRLAEVRDGVRQRGEHARVFIVPETFLTPADMRFFSPELEFVDSPANATHVVETDVERYRRRLGPHMTDDYWFTPWFNP